MKLFEFLKKGVEAISKKIKRIRRSDERTKRNWLLGSTFVAMIIVITLWIGYIQLTLPQVSSPTNATTTAPVEEEIEKSDSIFSVFSRGLKVTYQSISKNFSGAIDKVSNIIKNTKERFKNVKEYTPEDTESPFVSPEKDQ